jgi:hypothetical protein
VKAPVDTLKSSPDMLTKRSTFPLTVRAVQILIVLGGLVGGIEAAGRRHPWLMPAWHWQVEQFGVRFCCDPYRLLPDPELGFSMSPNQREVIRTPDYSFLIETDARGYPNRDPWPEDPTLVFLGDSMILGTGVGLDRSFTGLLARKLPDQSIVNLGLAATGPERQARVYRRFSGGWAPDLVVSCLFLATDFQNDFHFLSWLRDGQGSDYNTYRMQQARAHRKGVLQRIVEKSLTLDFAIQAMLRLIEGRDYVEKRYRFADGSEILFDRRALEFATTAASPDDPRLDTFVRSLARLQSVVERRGSKLAVMLIPSKEELFGAKVARTRLNLASRLKARLAEMSLPVLDLYPALQQRTARAPYFPRDLHLNAAGHRIVAEEFAAWFERSRRRGNAPIATRGHEPHGPPAFGSPGR